MTNAEALTQRIVGSNHAVQALNAGNQLVHLAAGKLGLVCPEAIRIEARIHGIKSESSPKRIVKHSQASVCGVHHTDNIHIAWHIELLIRIKQLQGIAALVILDEHKELAENLAQIAAVNFVDNEEILVFKVLAGLLAEVIEGTLLDFKAAAGTGGTEAFDEIFVCIALMELNQHHTVLVLLTHHG